MIHGRISRRRTQAVLASLWSCALLVGTSGCFSPDQALTDLNNAIAVISQESQAWRTELPQLLNQLQQIGSSLVAQVQQLINETLNDATADALCMTTYGQQIVLQLLNGIRIVNFFESQKPVFTPFVCAVQPTDITLAGIRSGEFTTATMIGFNLYPGNLDPRFSNPVMSAEFVNADRSVVTVPPGLPYIAENGNFEVQLSLANWNKANPLSDTTAGIQFLADGQVLNQGQVIVNPGNNGPDTITVLPVPNSTYLNGTNVNIQVTAASSTGSPLTYSATGLPPGLAIDSASGAITGVAPSPTHAAVWQPTITVKDSTGASSSVSTVITIGPIPNCHVVKNMLVCN